MIHAAINVCICFKFCIIDKTVTREGLNMTELFYNGHGSWRLTTNSENVIYIDPCSGSGYDLPANAVLVTHEHPDHNVVDKMPHASGCTVLRPADFQPSCGNYKQFDVCGIHIQPVQAGFNKDHDVAKCIGLVIDVDGVRVYFTGDTSMTDDMRCGKLAEMNIDYALFSCDGFFNMDVEEAIECAKLVKAKHNIPEHMVPMFDTNDQSNLFSEDVAKRFQVEGRLVIRPGASIKLEA